MAILTSYDDAGSGLAGYTSYGAIDGGSTNVTAQGFKVSAVYDLTSLQVRMYKFDGSPGTLTLEIRNVDGGGPGETVYATATASSPTSIAPPGELVTFTFSAPYYTLLAGTQYCWVLWLPSGDSENTIKTVRIGTSQYADGVAYNDTEGGASWNIRTTEDFMFVVNGVASTVAVPTTDRTFNKQLIAVGSNTLFYESSNALTELTAARNNINCTNLLQICAAYQKVFIANEAVFGVADFGNVKLSTADINAVLPTKGMLLTGDTNSAQMVVDYVDASTDGAAANIYGQRVTSALFVDEDIVTDADSTLSFVLNANETAGPHWYTWTVFGADTTTYGTLPDFASLICLYRGRVVLSGNKEYSYQWYMSRQNHPFDFNYAANDAQTAVAGNNADAGELGDIITALIPYKDDYLIFGCGSSIWYMAGDPAAGGSLNELDLTTGIYGAQSWCFDNEGNLYFWGTGGIYRTTIPGTPVNVSRIHLPNLVKAEAVDSSTHRITMAYDSRQNGILITITKFSDNSHSNYFYDLATKGFFPESSHANCAIYSQLFYQGDAPDYRRLLVGCADGYIRYYDEDTKSDIIADDTVTAINAYCTWGPLKLAQNDDYYGVLSALEVITAGGASDGTQADSSNVSFRIFVADTAEELLEKLAANTDYRVAGTIVAPGRPKGAKIRKRFRGMFLGIRLWNSTAAQTWSVNKIIGNIKKGGKFK